MDERCDPRFRPLLESQFDFAALELHPYAVLGLWPDTTLAYFNPAWLRFAEENCGQPVIQREWPLGRRYLAAIAEPLRSFYERLLLDAPECGMSLKPATHRYECSSPSTYREFAMQIYALPARQGWVLINSLSVEMPHDQISRRAHAPDVALYADENGLVRQCAHCRRVQRRDDENQWDWVPQWVEHPGDFISHGICATCFIYYFGKDLRASAGQVS